MNTPEITIEELAKINPGRLESGEIVRNDGIFSIDGRIGAWKGAVEWIGWWRIDVVWRVCGAGAG